MAASFPERGACCVNCLCVLVQSCQNRPAEFARCPRCPPGACQRRWLPLPVSVMLIFRCFPVQAGNFISYGVCKLVEGFTREVYFLVQPCRNRPAEFARCPRCPPGACQRRLLPFPVSVMLIFKCFLVQTVNLIFYGVCKLVEGFTREVYFLGLPCQNRPAEFARCSRCPPGACQRRWLPLPVSVMLIFKRFLMQVGDFISHGVCKFICLSSFMYNRFHKELRFFFSLLKRKKEAKKEKSSHSTCTTRSSITRRFTHQQNSPGGVTGGLSAVTLPFLLLKLGRKVGGDPPRA